jgi:hypothetical protein
MERLNTLWQVVNATANAAASVRDITQHTKQYTFALPNLATTFYLQAENAVVHIRRWDRPLIEATVRLQGAFGWRIATDQDDAGVYIAAKRRPLVGTFVGNLASATFDVTLPAQVYLMLKLEPGSLFLDHLNGTLHIPPLARTMSIVAQSVAPSRSKM